MRKPIQIIHAQRVQRLLNKNKRLWRGKKRKPVVVEKTTWLGNPYIAVWLRDHTFGVCLINKKIGWHSTGIPWVNESSIEIGACSYKAAMQSIEDVFYKGRKNKKRILDRYDKANKNRPKNMSIESQLKQEREQNTKEKQTMATAKAKKKKGSKKKITKKTATKTAGKNRGATTGFDITRGWIHVFMQNTKAKKSKRMTNAEITKWMRKEFKSKAAYFDNPNPVRSKYNRGEFTDGVVPKILSVPYDKDGNELPMRTRTAKPKPVAKAKAKAKKKKKKSKRTS